MLAFANLQMASEALFSFRRNRDDFGAEPGLTRSYSDPTELATDLVAGNARASKFTVKQAAEFASIWEVVEHKSNTATGFSGTLFRVRPGGVPPELLAKYGLTPGQLVLSFRSTEFLDDNARDNKGKLGSDSNFLSPVS